MYALLLGLIKFSQRVGWIGGQRIFCGWFGGCGQLYWIACDHLPPECTHFQAKIILNNTSLYSPDDALIVRNI